MWDNNTLSRWMVAQRSRRVAQPAPVSATAAVPLVRPDLAQLAQLPPSALPAFVQQCPVAMKYLALLGPLDWTHFPERPGGRAWPGHKPAPQAPFAAAVPWTDSAEHKKTFSPQGLPLCTAGLPMPLRSTFFQRSFCLAPHECGRFACPLLYPAPTGEVCPLAHDNWAKGGCITTLPTSVGNRIRHELNRQSPAFKAIYPQRTVIERINSQALALGIERPHLRNARTIANINTLICALINLRTLHRRQAGHPSNDCLPRGPCSSAASTRPSFMLLHLSLPCHLHHSAHKPAAPSTFPLFQPAASSC